MNKDIALQVKVYRNGRSNLREIHSPQELSKQEQRIVKEMVKEVRYYLPSYRAGKTINDILTISFTVDWGPERKIVDQLKIQREKGY